MSRFLCLAVFCIFLFASNTVISQVEKRTCTATRIEGNVPDIDGAMEEGIWNSTGWCGDFTQHHPYDGREPSQPTTFKVLYDDEAIYIGIMNYDSLPGKIIKRLTRRDDFAGDRTTVVIDSYHDKRTAFSFTINAMGVKGDEYVTNDGENWDETWNPIWYAKAAIHDTGWTAEIKIPYSQLRFGKEDEYVWGFQVIRNLFRSGEISQWQYIPQDAPGYVHHFGELHGIKGIKPRRQFDVTPYAVGKYETYEKDEDNPFLADGRESGVDAGVDAKIGLTNDLTLDMTINPDFGQVEADPSEVNLTAFETYFSEQRPFFIEGNNILSFQINGGGNSFARDNLFYSRRIGRRPVHDPDLDDDEYASVPDNTTILGAFKVTGKTRNGWSVGLLESVTQKEVAEIKNIESSETREEEAEPLTNYFGGRVQKDINDGNTIVGGMITATNRKITNPDIDYRPDAAYTGGFDFQKYWKNRTYNLAVSGVFSTVKGSAEAITNVQKSPVHYFQRPDADYVSIDTTRTSITGHGGTVSVSKTGQGHINAVFWVTWRSPGLELNDMGFLRSGDEVFQVFWAQYRIWEPFSIFNSMNINMNQWTGWDFGGRSTFYGGNINLNTQFKNYWFVSMGINRDGQSLSKGTLRGGPSFKHPATNNYFFYIESDERKKIQFGGSHSRVWCPTNQSRWFDFSLDVTIQPLDAFRISLSPFLDIRDSKIQYVNTADYGEEERYIVSRIEQKTFGLVGRLDFSITPDMSVQYYGQPFVSAGDYSEFKKVTDPQNEDYYKRFVQFNDEISYNEEDEVYEIDENGDGSMDYSFDNPDFNFLQFRSNLVFRWEYIPGSTVYLVWSQDKTDFDSAGEFDFGRNMNDLFSVTSHNIFLIKLSYRIGL